MTFPEEIQEYDSFSIGQRIQDIRLQKGIKALDMAVQVDLSKDQYSRIERGTSICKITTLHKIAQYLEVSTDYLLYGKTDEYSFKISELYTGVIGPLKTSSITFPGTEFHFNIAETSTLVSMTA